MNAIKFAVLFLAALSYAPLPASAMPVLGTELASFAVLGSTTVTNTGPTNLTGNLGLSPGTSITGFSAVDGGPGNFTGTAHQTDAFAGTAQTQLGQAMTSLGLMGPGTALGANLDGLTLTPGVYSFLTSAQLTGTLTLDGLENSNAFWVFQIPSTLTTASGSTVSVINTGADAGVFWNVGSSATLGATTSFAGNILASASITLVTGATMGCGGAFANTAAVTMDTNTVSTGCGGGLTVAAPGGVATPLQYAPLAAVPEPEIYAMLGIG